MACPLRCRHSAHGVMPCNLSRKGSLPMAGRSFLSLMSFPMRRMQTQPCPLPCRWQSTGRSATPVAFSFCAGAIKALWRTKSWRRKVPCMGAGPHSSSLNRLIIAMRRLCCRIARLRNWSRITRVWVEPRITSPGSTLVKATSKTWRRCSLNGRESCSTNPPCSCGKS